MDQDLRERKEDHIEEGHKNLPNAKPPGPRRFGANSHETNVEFSEPTGSTEDVTDSEHTELEASTHNIQKAHDENGKSQVHFQERSKKKDVERHEDNQRDSLLALATTKNKSSEGVDINQMMSQASSYRKRSSNKKCETSYHELQRSDFTPEV